MKSGKLHLVLVAIWSNRPFSRRREAIPDELCRSGKDSAILSINTDDSEALRRALGTVQQLLEKQCGNYKATQDEAADEELMRSKLNETKITKMEV